MELSKKNIPIVIKNLETQLNPLGFYYVSEKNDEYGPYHFFLRKDDVFIELIDIPFTGRGIVYKVIDVQLEKQAKKVTNVVNPYNNSLYTTMYGSYAIGTAFVEIHNDNFYDKIKFLGLQKDYFNEEYDGTNNKVTDYLNYILKEFNHIGFPFFEGIRSIENFILLLDKDSKKQKGLINTHNSAFAWEIRRILLAKDLGDSAYMEQCFKDFEQNLIDWASYTYYNKPDDYVYINYGYEVMKRAKRVIYENVSLDDLELIPIEVFPKRLTDYEQIYGRNSVDTSKPAIKIEEVNVQNTEVPVGNIDLMGISIVKGYREDFAEAFIAATQSDFVLDAYDVLNLEDASREFNSHAFYFTADEEGGWTAVTIMAEDITDVMPSIRDEMSYLDEILAELFPNAAIVTLNQYDAVGAFGFSVTEQGKKHRGYLNIESNLYEDYGEPLPEEKEQDTPLAAMFQITKRLTGFTFTEENMNKPMMALKQI